jgi:hypothetical protein
MAFFTVNCHPSRLSSRCSVDESTSHVVRLANRQAHGFDWGSEMRREQACDCSGWGNAVDSDVIFNDDGAQCSDQADKLGLYVSVAFSPK